RRRAGARRGPPAGPGRPSSGTLDDRPGADPLLRLDGVHAGYGEIEVLRGVSAEVRADEIVSIIGANGAGKSTLLRTVFGMVKPSGGSIRLAGLEIAGEEPVAVLRRGCSYVPQGRCNFPAMSVEENL